MDAIARMSRRSQFQIFPDVVEEVSPSLVHIEVRDGGGKRSCGSGFIVESDGVILTNAHVVNKHKANITVTLQDNRVLQGTVLDIDVPADLALLRIGASDLPKMKLGVSKNTRPGEWLIAMGSPKGLPNSVTIGVISNSSRSSAELTKFGFRGLPIIPEFIQIDAITTFGNSGGPLINLDGEAIGICTFGLRGSPGINFAIPIDYAKKFLPSFQISESLFGIRLSKRMHVSKANINLQDGMAIREVVKNSIGYRAGLRVRDILTFINGIPVSTKRDVRHQIWVGDVVLTLIRNRLGKWIPLKVRVTP